jgi:hypothetical protein
VKVDLMTEIFTIADIEKNYNIHRQTLHSRFNKLIDSNELIEGVDYRKLGVRMPDLLTPSGVEKLIKLSRRK